jgi:DNA anti-recombination protein RmuC
MAKKSISPIMTWVFWGILVLGVFLLVTREYFVAGFSADSSNITYLIVVFFLYGFFASLRVAYHLQAEFNALERMDASQRISNANASDAAALLDAAMERIRQGDRIDMKNLISSYGVKIKAKVDNIGVIAGMLVTMGLLGTVVGLIITVTGLGQVLSSSGSDYATMKSGLNQTVSGMGTAFYTTFFGALLGGVVLKVLGAEMKKSATLLVADTLRFSELFLAPKISETASEVLVNLEERVGRIGQQLEQLGSCFSSVIDTIDSKQSALAAGLGDLVATVEQTVETTNTQANDRVGALVASVDGAVRQSDERTEALVSMIEEASRVADERMGVISNSVEQSVANMNLQANERLQTLVATSKAMVEETNQTAEERLATLAKSIDQIVGETHRKADERLESLTSAIDKTTEQTHRLADERLGALIGTVESAATDTHQQANERLVKLVGQVGQSIDQSRREAEERLGAKASNLAQKLTEAASVLASLSETSPEKEPPQTEE